MAWTVKHLVITGGRERSLVARQLLRTQLGEQQLRLDHGDVFPIPQ